MFCALAMKSVAEYSVYPACVCVCLFICVFPESLLNHSFVLCGGISKLFGLYNRHDKTMCHVKNHIATLKVKVILHT